jgi:hypothetical protein
VFVSPKNWDSKGVSKAVSIISNAACWVNIIPDILAWAPSPTYP